jgi:hypothetical protein
VTAQRDSRDDGMPPDCARIEVRVGEIRQLFNSMDPAPFRSRDIDPKAGRYTKYEYGRLLHESVVIGAWVALWRPLEILLYDWWPILGEAWLFDRLRAMHVQVVRD